MAPTGVERVVVLGVVGAREADAAVEQRRRSHLDANEGALRDLLDQEPGPLTSLPSAVGTTPGGQVVLHGLVHGQRHASEPLRRVVRALVDEHRPRVFFEYRLARLMGQNKALELLTSTEVRQAVGARGTRMLLAGLAAAPVRALVARRAQHGGDPLLEVLNRARRDPRWLAAASAAVSLCIPPLHADDLALLAASSAGPTLALSVALADKVTALTDLTEPLHLVTGVLHVDQVAALLGDPALAATAKAALSAR